MCRLTTIRNRTNDEENGQEDDDDEEEEEEGTKWVKSNREPLIFLEKETKVVTVGASWLVRAWAGHVAHVAHWEKEIILSGYFSA